MLPSPRTLLLVVSLLFVSSNLMAESKFKEKLKEQNITETAVPDSTLPAMDRYNPELGYFQKAYTDLGDPRFMYGAGDFAIGIGGTVRASAYFDIYGSPTNNKPNFSLADISIPTDNANKFGLSASNSELHVKARRKLGKHQIIAYISMSVNDDEKIGLNLGYVSFDGFSIGKIYSFFMDLEAGTRTVDLSGPCSQIARAQPLLGYTHIFNKHWTVGISAEKPEAKAEGYPEWGVELDNQPMPDIAFRGKYSWSKGHLQAAGLLRNMTVWHHQRGTVAVDQGETLHELGWGVALSGKYAPSSKGHISFQTYYGRGIARYINDISGLNLDMGVNDWNASTGLAESMKPVPVCGGFIAGRYRWTRCISSNAVLGYVRAGHPDNMVVKNPFKYSLYGAVNVFWAITDYCSVGLEYTGGGRANYYEGNEPHYGRGNRINGTFIYQF